jgi:hypothetical protein
MAIPRFHMQGAGVALGRKSFYNNMNLWKVIQISRVRSIVFCTVITHLNGPGVLYHGHTFTLSICSFIYCVNFGLVLYWDFKQA